MVLTRLSHAGGSCPLGKDKQDNCFECSSEESGPSQAVPSGRAPLFQKPLPPKRVVPFHLLDLPVEVLEKIFSTLSFGEVSRLRMVCQKFNLVAGTTLTKTFHLLQNQTLQRFQAIKAQMPRRESLRRKHPLVTHCDIIETLNMRLTLLQMTFGKHMERKHICFFAGEILDEVIHVMGQLKSQNRLTIRITDELSDLSTMASEYFKEHIERRLPDLLSFGPDPDRISYPSSPGPGSTSASSVVDSSVGGDWDVWDDDDDLMVNAVLKKKIGKLSKQLKKSTAQLATVKKEMRGYKTRVDEQARVIEEYKSRLEDHDKKFDESARKLTTILQELNECKTELQYWRSRAAAPGSECCAAGLEPAAGLEVGLPPSPGAAALELLADGPLKSPQRWDAPPPVLAAGAVGAGDEARHTDDSEAEEGGESKIETRSKRRIVDGDESRRAAAAAAAAAPRAWKPRKRVKNN